MNKNINISHQLHNIPPVWNTDSKILILGSFPSVKSREMCFFYGHPQNRFWKVLSALFHEPLPVSIDEKKDFLLSHRIAVWDTIASCDITGSSDSSIKNVVPNDLLPLLNGSSIQKIFANGTASYDLYEKYLYGTTNIHAQKLPSTSPANAAWNLEKLCEAWSAILPYLS